MIMDRKVRRSTSVGSEEDPQTSSENGPDSPLSGDERATAPSPKKRRSIQKRVVQVPIADVEGSSSSRSGRGDAYPPSDSWAWRKYGQKPIKGSPYPRGYYRCSSSKGCPARKQVERNRLDPTQLIITYASDHNHPHPTSSSSSSSKHHHQNNNSNSAPPTAVNPPSPPTAISPSTSKDNITTTTIIEQDDHHNPVGDDDDDKTAGALFAGPPGCCDLDLDLGDEDNPLIMDFNWLSDVAFESAPSFMGPRCIDVVPDVGGVINISSTTITTGSSNNNNVIKMREEDEKLFADLDELPECSAVFRHGGGRPFDRCNLGPTATAAPVCGGTG